MLFLFFSLLALAGPNCKDSNSIQCPLWAANGECSKNSGFMKKNCKRSCRACGKNTCLLIYQSFRLFCCMGLLTMLGYSRARQAFPYFLMFFKGTPVNAQKAFLPIYRLYMLIALYPLVHITSWMPLGLTFPHCLWLASLRPESQDLTLFKTITRLGNRRLFPFRKRSLPFETVVAISQNGHCHLKRSMPFFSSELHSLELKRLRLLGAVSRWSYELGFGLGFCLG